MSNKQHFFQGPKIKIQLIESVSNKDRQLLYVLEFYYFFSILRIFVVFFINFVQNYILSKSVKTHKNFLRDWTTIRGHFFKLNY